MHQKDFSSIDESFFKMDNTKCSSEEEVVALCKYYKIGMHYDDFPNDENKLICFEAEEQYVQMYCSLAASQLEYIIREYYFGSGLAEKLSDESTPNGIKALLFVKRYDYFSELIGKKFVRTKNPSDYIEEFVEWYKRYYKEQYTIYGVDYSSPSLIDWQEENILDIPLTPAEYKVLRKGYAPDWDVRFTVHAYKRNIYLIRSGHWLGKLIYRQHSDGLYHIDEAYRNASFFQKEGAIEDIIRCIMIEGYFEPCILREAYIRNR